MAQAGSPTQFEFAFFLRAFNHRNYRLFFGGQAISLIGTWMQQVAMSWLVYRLTNSTFLLGVVGFTGQVPIFLFASLAGVFADRHNRHRILIVTQILSMVQALTLAFLTLGGFITVWHIIVLSILLGLINAFDMPARQSFVIEIVEQREDLGNAIALNSFMFNGARLIGPSLAGILIALTGEGTCFLLNGISFFTIILALLAMQVPLRERGKGIEHFWKGLWEGYAYAFTIAPIRSILLYLALISFLVMPYSVLMPFFARDYLHGGPHTLGFLMAASGTGALAGAVYLAMRKTIRGLERIIVVASVTFGLGLIAFAFSRVLALSLATLFFIGFGMIIQMASCNTILQTIVQEDMRGRVMSLFAVAMVGMAPFGSLFAGFLSSRIGPPHTLVISGCICILGALAFTRQFPRMRASQYGVSSL